MKEPEGATLDIVYRPVWEVDTPLVDLFQARPILRTADGVEIPNYMPLVRLPTIEATMKRQVKYLNQAFQALHIRFERGERFRLLVRINSLALATTEAASVVTEVFRGLSKGVRDNVVIEVSDFPQNMSLDNMDDITIPLMPFFDNLLACPELDRTDYTLFANLNYAGVTMHLNDKPMDLKLAGKLLQLFASRAAPRRLPMWVLGLPSQEVANVARMSEAAALSGSYMDADSMLPGPPLDGNQPFMV